MWNNTESQQSPVTKNPDAVPPAPTFTPGPWQKIGHTVCTFDSDRLEVAACNLTSRDAQLIAAAPELLAALRIIRGYTDCERRIDSLDQRAIAEHAARAIAKAEGRA
jgi:hypothetical protein